MKKFLEIFKDNNDWNEKSIIGFLAFAGIMIFAGTDLLTGILQRELIISDTIYNSLVIITLGAFGIGEAGKIFKKKE